MKKTIAKKKLRRKKGVKTNEKTVKFYEKTISWVHGGINE